MKRALAVVARRSTALGTVLALVLCTGTPGHVLAASSGRVPVPEAATGPSAAPGMAGVTASAAAPTAAELSSQARARFKAKDYDAAVRLFEQAHALDPNPNYLFNIGRVFEEKRNLRAAVDYYQRFVLEPRVELGAREQAVQRLRVLKAILNETEPNPAAGSATEGPASGPSTAGAAPPRADDPNPGMRLGGYALLGAGGVAMVVGGIFGGLTLAKRNELDDSMIVEDRRSLARQGTSFAIVADITLFTGAAFALAGLALVLVARKQRAPARAAVLPNIGRGHAGLTWSVRF